MANAHALLLLCGRLARGGDPRGGPRQSEIQGPVYRPGFLHRGIAAAIISSKERYTGTSVSRSRSINRPLDLGLARPTTRITATCLPAAKQQKRVCVCHWTLAQEWST